MKNLILFIDSLVAGGAQRQILILARLLVAHGFRVRILTYHDISDFEDLTNAYAIDVVCIERRTRSLFSFCYEVIRFLRASKPDAIISYLRGANVLARVLGRLAGVQTIITSERNLDLDKSLLWTTLEKLTIRLSTQVVTNSFAVRELVAQCTKYPIGKISVIYNAIDLEVFMVASASSRMEIRESHGIKSDDVVFLLVGRLVEQKNHFGLVEAFRYCARRDNVYLFFVGNELDESIKEEICNYADEHGLRGNIQFCGLQKQVTDFYHLADCLVLPSFWEGLPNVAIEAMACGLPVALSDVADNENLVGGDCGLLFQPGDRAALTSILEMVIADPNALRAKYADKARERIELLCSEKALLSGYLEVLGS